MEGEKEEEEEEQGLRESDDEDVYGELDDEFDEEEGVLRVVLRADNVFDDVGAIMFCDGIAACCDMRRADFMGWGC